MILRIIIYSILAVLGSVPQLQAQSASDIIDRFMDTVSNGAHAHWKEIKSAFVEYDAYHDLQKQINKASQLFRCYAPPLKVIQGLARQGKDSDICGP